jgi:carboxypeptidase C (cathepsin A)
MSIKTSFAAMALAIFLSAAMAENHAMAAPAEDIKLITQAAPGSTNMPMPQRFVSRHQARIGGRLLNYEAVVEENILHNSQGQPTASLYSFSYLLHQEKSAPARPVLFVFNGGPGSSSIWTHLGMLGPRQVSLPDPLHPPTIPPFEIKDSEHSPLDVADLVFIDPVLTGFSRLLPNGQAQDYLGVTQDADATAELMRQWLTRHGRWNSPKFVLGESYGTTRAIALASSLLGGVLPPQGVLGGSTLNGIIVLGPAFTMGQEGVAGDDSKLLSLLPTMAAAAWYHKRLDPQVGTLQQAMEAARGFAQGDYLLALNQGYSLAEPQRQAIAQRLAQLTGLSKQQWLDANLRISVSEFQGLLLKERGLAIGAYDARYTLPLLAAGQDPVVDDPAMGQYAPAFTTILKQYMAQELGVTITESYIPINFKDVNFKWDYGVLPRNDAPALALAMRRNPSLRVFIGAGNYDLVTTVGGAQYTLAHSPVARERLTFKSYDSGHMPYLGEQSARTLAQDLRLFIRGASEKN